MTIESFSLRFRVFLIPVLFYLGFRTNYSKKFLFCSEFGELLLMYSMAVGMIVFGVLYTIEIFSLYPYKKVPQRGN